jgi:hypothetical protein
MKSSAHEKKILENILEVTYCTECLEDYLFYSLIQFGNTWKHLCWGCYRNAIRQIREEVTAKRDNNSEQPTKE